MALLSANTAITEALTQVATQATGVLNSVAPAAIGVTGMFLVWKLGIRFFKSIAKG